jgi:hypothetical protein
MCQISLLVVLAYGLLLYSVNPYLLREYNKIDLISSLSSFFTIYFTMIVTNIGKTNLSSAMIILLMLCTIISLK